MSKGRGNVRWTASSTGIQGVSLTPASGLLTTGQSASITMTVPDTICPATLTLTIDGWANPLSIPWTCAAPQLSFLHVDCSQGSDHYTCDFPLRLDPLTPGMAQWSAVPDKPGVIVSPTSGLLHSGQTQILHVIIPFQYWLNGCAVVTIQGGAVYNMGLDPQLCGY